MMTISWFAFRINFEQITHRVQHSEGITVLKNGKPIIDVIPRKRCVRAATKLIGRKKVREPFRSTPASHTLISMR